MEDLASAPVDDLFLLPRAPGCTPELIDLTPYYNVRLDGWLHPEINDHFVDNGLAGFRAGMVTLLGIKFDARGVILIRSFERRGGDRQSMWQRYPVRLEGIQVRQRVRKLHVLQAVCAADEAERGGGTDIEEGTQVGSYVWHFTGAAAYEQPILYGRDLRHWWMPNAERPVELERGRIAWIGDTPLARKFGARVRLYLTTYVNPRPELEVSHLDIVSKMTQAAPFLVAMTVEP